MQHTDEQTEEPDDGKALFGRDAMANYMFVGARQLGGNLFEVKFEDFEADAFGTTKLAYEKLGIREFDCAEAAIRQYTDRKKGYKKNKYEYKPRTIQLVNENWGYALKDWDYEIHP